MIRKTYVQYGNIVNVTKRLMFSVFSSTPLFTDYVIEKRKLKINPKAYYCVFLEMQ